MAVELAPRLSVIGKPLSNGLILPADSKGEYGKIVGTPRRGLHSCQGEHHATVRSLAMRLDPTTLSPFPMAEAWWSRFVEKIDVDENGCWLWTRRLDQEGYGHVSISRRNWLVHRAAYIALIGPIPTGMTLDHLCHTNARNCPGGRSCLHRRCANPWHCEPATNIENVMRGNSVPAQRARQTTCKQGHPLSGSNVITRGTHRLCKVCTYGRIAARRSEKRATTPSPSQLRVLRVLAAGGSLQSLEFSHLMLCAAVTGEPICRVSRTTRAWLCRRGWISDHDSLTDAGMAALIRCSEGVA